MTPLVPVSAPVQEPVSLAEARLQCRLTADDTTAEDSRLQAYIVAVRTMAEHETGCRLITQTWLATLDAFPASGQIVLPQQPVQAVLDVSYVSAGGTLTTLDPSRYRLIATGLRPVVCPAYNATWPADARTDDLAAVTVRYRVGFGDNAGAVPQAIREWMLLHVAAMFDNRAAIGKPFEKLPYLDSLLNPWRMYA